MIKNKAKYNRRINPYTKTQPHRSAKATLKTMTDDVLDLNSDTENELLKSESGSSLNTIVSSGSTSNVAAVNIDEAKMEMIKLLKEIRDSQSTQCTKKDLHDYSQTIATKINDLDVRVTSNSSSINSISSRMKTIESSLERSNHETELAKQNILSNNLSIMGIPMIENEDLPSIALRLFAWVGCSLTKDDIYGCYRIKKGITFTDIFIVKFKDFTLKHRVMKAKSSKEVKLSDVMQSSTTNQNPCVFINNHVTPFFGKLLAEGRKAVKNKKILAVWLNKNGCHVRLDSNGAERIYRSVTELNELISSNHGPSTNPKKRSKPDDIGTSPSSNQRSKK